MATPAGGAMPEEVDPYAVSKTESSQLLKGSQSYYYWHADAERRRVTGETPVPIPVPKKLASSEAVSKQKVKTIEGFSFMDDSNMVKVYIPLEGELAGVTMDQVEAEFSERSLNVAIDLGGTLHRFYVDRLSHSVDAGRCKAIINKSGKLVLKLYKRNEYDRWQKLRALT